MDLPILKSLSLNALPMSSAVSGLLAPLGVSSQFQFRAANTIIENILSVTSPFEPRTNSRPTIWDKLLVPSSAISNLRILPSEILLNPWSNSTANRLTELYESSVPMTLAFEKLGRNFNAQEFFGKDSQRSHTSPLEILEGISNSFSNNSIPSSYFNSSLPLSYLKEMPFKQKTDQHTKGSIPNRTPYESKEARKDRSENRRYSGGLLNLFQKYLKQLSSRRSAE